MKWPHNKDALVSNIYHFLNRRLGKAGTSVSRNEMPPSLVDLWLDRTFKECIHA